MNFFLDRIGINSSDAPTLFPCTSHNTRVERERENRDMLFDNFRVIDKASDQEIEQVDSG